MRYECATGVYQEARGEYVKFEDVKILCTSTIEFVTNLIDQLEADELTKTDAVNALEVMFKVITC
jgi:hypothetical protein